MTQEGKAVSRAVLTVCLYAMTSFFSLGESIFPFPLNELIFFVVVIYFASIHLKENRYLMLSILLAGLLGILSNQFYWEIVFNSENMLHISEKDIPTKFKYLYQFGLILWITLTFIKQPSIKHKIIGLLPVLILITGIYLHQPLFEFLSIFLLFIYAIIEVRNTPLLYLWILLFILECTKLWHLASFN